MRHNRIIIERRMAVRRRLRPFPGDNISRATGVIGGTVVTRLGIAIGRVLGRMAWISAEVRRGKKLGRTRS